jgi:hypothetical protein
MDLAPNSGGAPPLRFLAGTSLAVTVAAGPGEEGRSGQWQFAFGQQVLAGGVFQLDESRQGRFSLTLPDVRHRTACSLTVSVAQTSARLRQGEAPLRRGKARPQREARLRRSSRGWRRRSRHPRPPGAPRPRP